MTTPVRVVAVAASVGLVVGGAALAGAALEPLRDGSAGGEDPAHGAEATMGAGHAADAAPPGLAVAAEGLSLELEGTELPRDRATELAFRVVDGTGGAVTDMEVEHERRMHLIVVRRDLTGYRHLHPVADARGRWTVPLRLREAGTYRVYADFHRDGAAHTLAADLSVAGAFAPAPLPAPEEAATDGRYRARLAATGVRAGATVELDYALSRDGAPLRGVEPYLGADGHLVALREGDLAFLHVHPRASGAPGRIRFGAEMPSPGRYRLFLQFRHGSAVRTVAHTLEVSR